MLSIIHFLHIPCNKDIRIQATVAMLGEKILRGLAQLHFEQTWSLVIKFERSKLVLVKIRF